MGDTLFRFAGDTLTGLSSFCARAGDLGCCASSSFSDESIIAYPAVRYVPVKKRLGPYLGLEFIALRFFGLANSGLLLDHEQRNTKGAM